MPTAYGTNIFEQNLLLEHLRLKAITNSYKRFYIYRTMTEDEFADRDRSTTAKNIYKKLNWYDESNDRNLLEPDTFFASSHFLVSNLFKKYDFNYYRYDYKRYCISKMIDYDTLPDSEARYYRYLWMTESNVMSHYECIVNNPSVLDFIDATHKIGNFMIVPKGFGWNPKVTSFNESFIKSLQFIQDNWSTFSKNYNSISFQSWKELYLLEDCYENGNLRSSLEIDFNQPFTVIFTALENIISLINERTQKISLRLEDVA